MKPAPGPSMLHLYLWDPAAVAIDPAGHYIRPPSRPGYLGTGVLRMGAWKCLFCRGLEQFHSRYCASCPGLIRPATQSLTEGDNHR